MELTLRKISEIRKALMSIEETTGFEIGVSYRLSMLRNEVDEPVKAYLKARDAMIEPKKMESVEGLKEGVDYMMVGVKQAYNIPVSIADFSVIEDDLNKLLDAKDTDNQIKERSFNLKDFQQEVMELAEDGKKRVKKRVSLVTPAFLSAMSPFLTEVEETETVKT